MNKLISFDLKSDLGFFKVPDLNDVYLTYNMIHKPALLGILGSILGLSGYTENSKMPEYYEKLKHLKIGIEPLNSENGTYQKMMVKYVNSTGFANDDGNLIVTEQILIKPEFRCYLLLDIDNSVEKLLYRRIKSQESYYIPYFGKNDFQLWWEKDLVKEYNFEIFDYSKNFKINTIFKKDTAIREYIAKTYSRTGSISFHHFERLPINYDEVLFQYNFGDFVFSDATFEKNMIFESTIYDLDNKDIIQLF